MVAHVFEQTIAQLRPAQIAACAAARTDDHGFARQCFLREHDLEFSSFLPQRLHLAARAQFDVFPLRERQPQHIHHAVCAVADGIDAAGLFRRRQQAERAEPRKRLLRAEARKRVFAESGVLAVIVFRRQIPV